MLHIYLCVGSFTCPALVQETANIMFHPNGIKMGFRLWMSMENLGSLNMVNILLLANQYYSMPNVI